MQAFHQHDVGRRRARRIDHEVEALERAQVPGITGVRGGLEALDADTGGEMDGVEDEPGAEALPAVRGVDGNAQARHLRHAALERGRRHGSLAVPCDDDRVAGRDEALVGRRAGEERPERRALVGVQRAQDDLPPVLQDDGLRVVRERVVAHAGSQPALYSRATRLEKEGALGYPARMHAVLALGVGLVGGGLGGLIGLGGGFIMVPLLVWLFHMSQHDAQGTSLAVLLPPVGILSVLQYWRAGHVDVPVAVWAAAGFLVGGWVGGGLAQLLGGAALRRVFALFLIVAALDLLRR